MGTRIINANGLVRTMLSPIVGATAQSLLNADGSVRVCEDENGGGGGDSDGGDDPFITQTYVFVPPHPGLRSFLPELSVMGKLHIKSLATETASPMRKNRQCDTYFRRMLLQSDPAEFCLDAMVHPIRPDLFMDLIDNGSGGQAPPPSSSSDGSARPAQRNSKRQRAGANHEPTADDLPTFQ
jgi:hypothetical protein